MADGQDNDKFYKYFRQELTDIEERINNVPKTSSIGEERKLLIDHCYAAINRLSDEAIKASIYLAPHDRRTYGEAIAGLRSQLTKTQDSINGKKKKFSFKSGGSRSANPPQAENAGPSANEESAESTVAQTTDTARDDIAKAAPIQSTSTPRTGKAVDLQDHHRQHLQIPSYHGAERCSGSIVKVHRCVIDKKMANEEEKGTTLASLTLKNISESLVICGSVDGPVHLTNITDSIIVTASKQFRMHESRGCDVYLHTSSRPIIEDCEGIRFAPLPELYQVERAKGTEEQWREVDDFNWHRLDPSPNWSVMGDADRIKEETWKDVVPGKPFQGVEDILSALNIVKGSL